jgi:hypothetical protein
MTYPPVERLSPRTLERWRWEGIGPHYVKIGGRVVYNLDDVEEYELARVRKCVRVEPAANPAFAGRYLRRSY